MDGETQHLRAKELARNCAEAARLIDAFYGSEAVTETLSIYNSRAHAHVVRALGGMAGAMAAIAERKGGHEWEDIASYCQERHEDIKIALATAYMFAAFASRDSLGDFSLEGFMNPARKETFALVKTRLAQCADTVGQALASHQDAANLSRDPRNGKSVPLGMATQLAAIIGIPKAKAKASVSLIYQEAGNCLKIIHGGFFKAYTGEMVFHHSSAHSPSGQSRPR